MGKFPPDTDNIDILAKFFDKVDITELEGLEEVPDKPERDLVHLSLRLPREDVEAFKQVAKKAGVGHTTLIRMVLRNYLDSFQKGKARP
ncbi:MAG: BrnA antitoxin family protein [Firmicutes bacterium]|nr:BrnA antitoxin family protein [Bacillota bacterium]